jgi:alkylated DNA repair dioxygenase AlkB
MQAQAPEHIVLEGGSLLLYPQAFAADSARLFEALMRDVHWQQHQLKIFGRQVAAPRLSAWHADPGCRYRYSGLSLEPLPFSAAMSEIRRRAEELAGQAFNSVLLNLYRDGADSMGWHSDDERELGPAPLIASVSLGATRRFVLRRRDARGESLGIELHDGSLLLMLPPLQRFWQHALPKTRRLGKARINLTWRHVSVA